MQTPKRKEKPYNKWLSLVNIPFQMGIIILVGVFLGKWLDQILFDGQRQLFLIIVSLFAVFVALYQVIKQVNSLNK